MKTKEAILKEYLISEPKARERRNKIHAICNLLHRNHPAIQGISKDVLMGIIDEVIAYERLWRKILLDNPNLRGVDYETKKQIVQKKQIELDYESGYYGFTRR